MKLPFPDMENSGGAHWGMIMMSFVLNTAHLRCILEIQKEKAEKVKRDKLGIHICHSLEHMLFKAIGMD